MLQVCGKTVRETSKRTLELTGSPEERQEVVVVESPDAVRSSRFKPVGLLERAHGLDVPGRDKRAQEKSASEVRGRRDLERGRSSRLAPISKEWTDSQNTLMTSAVLSSTVKTPSLRRQSLGDEREDGDW